MDGNRGNRQVIRLVFATLHNDSVVGSIPTGAMNVVVISPPVRVRLGQNNCLLCEKCPKFAFSLMSRHIGNQ